MAKNGMQTAFELWRGRDRARQQHGLTRKMFDSTFPNNIWGEVEQFLTGTPRADLPKLRELAGAIASIRACERSIEGELAHRFDRLVDR
jgi:hypothetical protein